MQPLKLSEDVWDVARRSTDRWYVTVGQTAVGPVNLDLLARGVEAGKVPLSAFVRHEAWKVWRPLAELALVSNDVASAPASRDARETTDDITDAPRSSAPPQSTAHGSHADDAAALSVERHDALLVLMTAAVARGNAEAAIVRAVTEDGDVIVCAHGPGAGAETQSDAARPAEGALLLPVRVRGTLVATLELGRPTPFASDEITSLEALVDALVEKLEKHG
jgi:hypothetical protein